MCVSEGKNGAVNRREGGKGGARQGPEDMGGQEEGVLSRPRREARTQCPGELPLQVGEGKCRGSELLRVRASVVFMVMLFLFSVIMDKYQEQPHLLDPHLGKSSSG